MPRPPVVAFLLAAAIVPSSRAAERALFTDGRALTIERHEPAGAGAILLHLADGTLTVPASQILEFRVETPEPQAEPASAPERARPETVREIASRLALEMGVEERLVEAVIAVESAWDPFAVSPKGAAGLMQLMPATARRLGVGDVFDPEENLRAGILHLKSLLGRYDGDLGRALAAYNAGEGAVDRHHGIPPYSETTNYVIRILRRYLRP